MHDPLTVAFTIPRPWPRRANWSTRRWYWPALVTVWHVDPETDGTDDSCGWFTNRWWKFHVHHWRLQVHPWQALRRWLFTRCEFCGERFSRRRKDTGPNPIRKQVMWGPPQRRRKRVFQGERFLFHSDCCERFDALDLQRAKAIVTHDERRQAARDA